MGTAILRGISAALLTTLLILLAGLAWVGFGFGELSPTLLVDVGLIASSVVAGWRAGRDSGFWIAGGLAGAGYVGVAIVLLALFYPISLWGALQVLGQGILIGGISGIIGAGGLKGYIHMRSPRNYNYWPRYSYAHERLEPNLPRSQSTDYHVDDWNTPLADEPETRETIYPVRPLRRGNSRWWEDEL